jgi:hypothetical protein
VLVEVDDIESVLAEMLEVFEADNVVLLVELRLSVTDVLVAFEELAIIRLGDAVCACACAENPGKVNRSARKAMVVRM